MAQMETLIANRYRMLEKIGAGGMGTVSRVHDRLMDTTVALKQVLIPAKQLQSNASSGMRDEYLALATEFRILANLRHPHVIRVLDYGFDDEGHPFFTMEYLPDAQSVTDKIEKGFTDSTLTHLTQMLEALSYLHRHAIIHRDIKPANVLLNGVDQVKVLDFGLAMEVKRDQSMDDTGVAGTIAYMAPELLSGEPATVQSDIYAVGLIAYELCTRQFPFKRTSITQLISDIMLVTPDVSQIDERIRDLVESLLDKDPVERPESTAEVIEDLYEAIGADTPAESSLIRESYLQASRFVGRDSEFDILNSALKQLSDDNRSSFWLIGGESGVGKSRLVEELRTHALVRGVRVLRGQAVENGGLPYQLWRDILRPLSLSTDLSNLEAGILREIVPDIDRLLEREIPKVEALSAKANQERLALTIIDSLKRQEQKLLLILEDLQWTGESLEILKTILRLNEQVQTPIMIIATHRTDESPHLPDQLSQMQPMALQRLDKETIAQLSGSILGKVGQNDELVELLNKETEGNIFFIIEVVRALAEAAGRLANIGQAGLPQQIMAGGMRAILQKRLAGIPKQFQDLLRLAAVAGRQLDQKLLAQIADETRLDAVITAGANTAVFDFVDGNWRFAHDKLRETLLADIDAEERKSLHRSIAEAIEITYPDSEEDYAEALAIHWDVAGEAEKAVKNIIIASKRLVEITAEFERAEKMLNRGLELAQDIQNTAPYLSQLHGLMGGIQKRHGDAEQAKKSYELCLKYAEDNKELQIIALNWLSEVAYRLSQYDESHDFAEKALQIAKQSGNLLGQGVAERNLALLYNARGEHDTGQYHLEQSIKIFAEQNERYQLALSYRNAGISYVVRGNNEQAFDYFSKSLELSKYLENTLGIAADLTNLGVIARLENKYNLAQTHFEEALTLNRRLGAKRSIAICLSNLGMVATQQENFSEALEYFEDSLKIYRETNNLDSVISVLNEQAHLYLELNQLPEALKALIESLNLVREIKNDASMLSILMLIARYQLMRGHIQSCELLIEIIETHPATQAADRQVFLEPVKNQLPEYAEDIERKRSAEKILETGLNSFVTNLLGELQGET